MRGVLHRDDTHSERVSTIYDGISNPFKNYISAFELQYKCKCAARSTFVTATGNPYKTYMIYTHLYSNSVEEV